MGIYAKALKIYIKKLQFYKIRVEKIPIKK